MRECSLWVKCTVTLLCERRMSFSLVEGGCYSRYLGEGRLIVNTYRFSCDVISIDNMHTLSNGILTPTRLLWEGFDHSSVLQNEDKF